MSSEEHTSFTKDNIDTYLKELAKEYRKLGGRKIPAEIVLVGGASVLINYGFREMTTDIDAIIQSASTMKEAINHVEEKHGLPRGWLNEDFLTTTSYTPKLIQYSIYYKTFYGVLDVRTVSGEYLVAMKLRSGRQYKSDLSDIVGILAAHEKIDKPISKEMIDKAVCDLYESWEEIPEISRTFIEMILSDGDYAELIAKTKMEEKETKETLLEFEARYPERANTQNVDEIISLLKNRKNTDGQK